MVNLTCPVLDKTAQQEADKSGLREELVAAAVKLFVREGMKMLKQDI